MSSRTAVDFPGINNMGQITVPTEDEVLRFFDKSTSAASWQSVSTLADWSGPAVYFVRLLNGKAIPRWFSQDEDRILYIGSSATGKGGLQARSRQMQCMKHGVLIRLDEFTKVCPAKFEQPIECDYFFVRINEPMRAKFWESYLLHSYLYHFGDSPPLNGKREYNVFKKHDIDGTKVHSWALIQNCLKQDR